MKKDIIELNNIKNYVSDQLEKYNMLSPIASKNTRKKYHFDVQGLDSMIIGYIERLEYLLEVEKNK